MTRNSKREGEPTVVLDNLHVHYKTHATGRRAREGRQLLKRQRGIKVVKAVKGVSFIARQGESIGVIGHNGSGKSSMLRAIAGLIAPAKGAVWADGQPALLGVNAVMIPKLSGARNIELGALAMGMSKAELAEKYDDIVAFSGIEEFLELPMKTYSSGMSARLRFSVAMARQHSITLVDEALAVGDKDFRARGEARIREMCKTASTVFLVSHSMKSIADTCNRVLWIDRGELRMDGPVDEVIGAYQAEQ